MKIVFSIGGSIFAPEQQDTKYVSEVAKLLLQLSKNNEVAAVVGGGWPARCAIKKSRDAGASWAECDHIGILATRENAKKLILEIGSSANQKIPETIHDAAKLFGKGKVLVMGGTEPGHSTDAVAALIADWVGADLFINASNVDAVYDKNPKKYADAKPISEITIDELMHLLKDEGVNAGEYPLLDHTAIRIIKRAKTPTIVLDGRDLKNMRNAAEGSSFNGTKILF